MLLRKLQSGLCVVLGCFAAQVSSYFMITEPSRTTQWANGKSNLVTWSKGALDGVESFDIEMARLSQDGLIFVANNVPAKSASLNIALQDIPPGDDYFLLFLNSTHGVMYTTSARFTVLASSASASANGGSPDGNAPTVTVSGAPNPTQAFATTFAAVANGGRALISLINWSGGLWGVGAVILSGTMGAMWTLW